MNELPPTPWRTRIQHLQGEFEAGGPLVGEFREVRKIESTDGDLAGQAAISRLVARHPDLFPGEAGWTLAWAIVCDGTVLTPT